MRLALSIDASTLTHLAVHARGLLRLRVDNSGDLALPPVALHATLAGEALPAVETPILPPGASAVLVVAAMPAVAGYHALAGELRAGPRVHARFGDVHLRVAGEGTHVNLVNIDQSSARVVDNSRSTFAASEAGGLLGAATWQPIELVDLTVPQPVPEPLARVDFTVTTAARTYHATEMLARGDLATIYGAGELAIKIADQASDNDLLQHEVRVLGLLLAKPEPTAIHFVPPRDQFRTADGRLGTVFDRLDRLGGLDLTALRDRCRARGEPGVPARHVVWILRRAFAALGTAHREGILHGNVNPSHVFVRGRDHMVWLVDWCWAVVDPAHTGQGFKVLDEVYSPPEVTARGAPTPASDIYALGKCAILALGGDPATKTLPPDIDARFARFVRYLCLESQGGRGQDAWELYLQLGRIREQIWGAHEFVPLLH